jgi:hypothetical protein
MATVTARTVSAYSKRAEQWQNPYFPAHNSRGRMHPVTDTISCIDIDIDLAL